MWSSYVYNEYILLLDKFKCQKPRMYPSRMRTAHTLLYGGSPWETETTPPPRGQTNTCENITFGKLLCGQ